MLLFSDFRDCLCLSCVFALLDVDPFKNASISSTRDDDHHFARDYATEHAQSDVGVAAGRRAARGGGLCLALGLV